MLSVESVKTPELMMRYSVLYCRERSAMEEKRGIQGKDMP